MNLLLMLLDLLFPRRCAGCSARGPAWCPDCAASVGALFEVRRTALATPAYAVAAYAGPARGLVLAYKERGRRELAAPIGLLMAAAVPQVLARAGPAAGARCWLVAAPSRAAALRRRGGNHVALAARHAARALAGRGVRVEVAPALRLRRGARDSVGLARQARRANLSGRVVVRGALPARGDPVLLIDDVITTGATASACTAALRAAGVEVSAVLSLTATT